MASAAFELAGILLQVETLYGASRPCWSALTANAVPMSSTSGARLWPLSWVIALISSWLDPSGLASLILMPYLAVKSFIIVP